MQKALTPQHPSKDDRFATCGLLTTTICWRGGAVKKNSNNSLKNWRKLLLVMAW